MFLFLYVFIFILTKINTFLFLVLCEFSYIKTNMLTMNLYVLYLFCKSFYFLSISIKIVIY